MVQYKYQTSVESENNSHNINNVTNDLCFHK